MNKALLFLGLMLVVAACTPVRSEPQASLTVAEALGGVAREGFSRVTAPRPFVFPADHGPHPDYAAEWWYYTGNLQTAEGRRFGYQFTIFRFGMAPGEAERDSAWAANQIYMAHLALSDVAGNRFFAFERFSRGAAGLAGADGLPFRVWLEDWQVRGLDDTAFPMEIQAAQDGVALQLQLEAGKPVVLQGEQGLSQKSAEPGNASYYYSLTRMPTTGQITIQGETFAVTGSSWMDREWSTSALSADQVGWDWFALQLDNGQDLMYYQLRLRDGRVDPYSKGMLVEADGQYRRVGADDVQLEVLDRWQSPRNGATYPARWRLQLPSAAIDLTITPQLRDQELPVTITYWEGSVALSGTVAGQPVRGFGYVELTGYLDQARDDGLQVR